MSWDKEYETPSLISLSFTITFYKALASKLVATETKAAIGLFEPILFNSDKTAAA